MQTILGSGGIIGVEASFCLFEFADHIRQVSRNPKKVNDSDQIYPADLRVEAEVRAAVKGSKVVYLTAGLPYNTKIWQEYWPIIMTNTIKACQEHNAKLVFFDNVYMYGKVEGWMTEETPYNPCSKKGEIRAKIATQLMDEMKKGNINGLIARSADFYGPKVTNSFITPLIFEKLKAGKKPEILLNPHAKHSFTYTPDAAQSMALLGNTPDAFGQVWHLPTDKNVLTTAEFAAVAGQHFQTKNKYKVLSSSMISLAGLFSPIIKETKEMLYQNKYDYLFSSEKFENQFFAPTKYEDGIKTIYQTQYK